MAFEKIMSENSEQLSCDVGSIFVPKTVSEILAEVSMIRDFSEKSSKLDFHVFSLEEEMRKVDAFKRELPHCLHLLKDAIETLKKEKMQTLKGRGMMEDLIPAKSDDGRAKVSNDISEKKNWMSCIQLWSTPIQYENSFDTKSQNTILPIKPRDEEEEGRGYECHFSKRKGGAFVPFKRSSSIIREEKKDVGVPTAEGLSLSTPIDLNVKDNCGSSIRTKQLQVLQQHRKQRRCWCPDLHKRFVDALLHLGGPQTATPKQIRELMKVDGLTNDEVKSHLQKYRLHIRKLPSTSAELPWWLNNECGESSKGMGAQSGSPEDHLHEGGSASARRGSATGGDSMEDEEDGKLGKHTWKQRF